MRLIGLDAETTGLDVLNDRILKLAIVIFEPGLKVPFLETEYTLWHESYPEMSKEAHEVHGIHMDHVKEFGENPKDVFAEILKIIEKHDIDGIVAHNGHRFDFRILQSNAEKFFPPLALKLLSLLKVDTYTDLPSSGKRLTYLAAEHGFLNPWPHSSLADVLTMIRIMNIYPWENILRRAISPMIKIMAQTSFEESDKPKRAGFAWDQKTRTWVKYLKRCDLEESNFEFNVSIIGG